MTAYIWKREGKIMWKQPLQNAQLKILYNEKSTPGSRAKDLLEIIIVKYRLNLMVNK